jgi:hypothetical protein
LQPPALAKVASQPAFYPLPGFRIEQEDSHDISEETGREQERSGEENQRPIQEFLVGHAPLRQLLLEAPPDLQAGALRQ